MKIIVDFICIAKEELTAQNASPKEKRYE